MQLYNTEPFYKKLKPFYGSFILLPLMLYIAFNRGKYFLIDWFNLLIHEGGHGIFMFFGKFIHASGGTLMQIILPSLFVWSALKKKYIFLTQLSLIWLGENLVSISVYAADARVQKLRLIGGYHDWTYLLGVTGIIEYDKAVGMFFYSASIGVFIIAFLLPLFVNSKPSKNVNLDK